ncbi:hypothetical protein LNKW23_09820 [Paralimibaculum aggregatum]|uniref:Glycosyltransferase 2-like domain-containing protein n=1 Tax=Paralimibaculum aggregatum TaxID=3036245 RepID=A0ABQ6LEI9_9RHOB|nr:hypothetical protein LNKW23_09820 [Limibaculum sp. NKW23]
MPAPALSVVMPAWNAAAHVGEALESLIAQGRQDLEALVIDDGSTDATAEIVAAEIPRAAAAGLALRLLRQANAGPSAARNRGIAEARGPLVGFLDADDRWHPAKAARHIALMRARPEIDLSYSGFRDIDAAGRDLLQGYLPRREILEHGALLEGNVMHTSTIVARTEVLRRLGGFDTGLRTYEDFDLWLRIAALRPGNIAAVRERLVDYRRHPAQTTRSWERMHEGWRMVVAREARTHPEAWARVRRLAWGNQLEYCASMAYNAGDMAAMRRLIRRAWAEGGPRLATRKYPLLMTAVALASHLPRPVQRALSRAHRALRGWAQRREARQIGAEPPPMAERAARRLADLLHGAGTALARRPNPAHPFRSLPPAPGAAKLEAMAARCERILEDSIAGFFLQNADTAHGGYLEDAGPAGFFDRGDKVLLMQARCLWFFSELAGAGLRAAEAQAAAAQGLRHLMARFHDPATGGFHDRVAADGRVLDPLRLLRHQSCAIFALARHARLTGSETAAGAARGALGALARDPAGRWLDCAAPGGEPAGAEDCARHLTQPGARSFDSEIHLLEALIELCRLDPDPAHRRQLEAALLRCLTGFRLPGRPASLTGWDNASDRPLPGRLNAQLAPGHDLELVWFAFEALRVLGQPPETLLPWARQVCDAALTHGFDAARGGFYNRAGQRGPQFLVPERAKLWWVQAEAMVAMLEMHALTGETRWFEALRRTLGFVEAHMLAPGGGWWRAVDSRGRLRDARRAAADQGPYHNGRAMLRLAAGLRRLAAGEGAR